MDNNQLEFQWRSKLEARLHYATEDEVVSFLNGYLDELYRLEEWQAGVFRVGRTRGELEESLLKTEVRIRTPSIKQAYELGFVVMTSAMEQSLNQRHQLEYVRYTLK